VLKPPPGSRAWLAFAQERLDLSFKDLVPVEWQLMSARGDGRDLSSDNVRQQHLLEGMLLGGIRYPTEKLKIPKIDGFSA
jgi:hypothetical protein